MPYLQTLPAERRDRRLCQTGCGGQDNQGQGRRQSREKITRPVGRIAGRAQSRASPAPQGRQSGPKDFCRPVRAWSASTPLGGNAGQAMILRLRRQNGFVTRASLAPYAYIWKYADKPIKSAASAEK